MLLKRRMRKEAASAGMGHVTAFTRAHARKGCNVRLYYARVFFDTGPLPANLPFTPQLLANKLAVHRDRRR